MFRFVKRVSSSTLMQFSSLTHVKPDGQITMVDIGDKRSTRRRAVAEAIVKFPDRITFQSYFDVTNKKGDARLCSKLAGILAAKVSVRLKII